MSPSLDRYYKCLGLENSATPDEVKAAYRKLIAQAHPDRGGDPDKFKEIQEAYETLSDPEKAIAAQDSGQAEQDKQANDIREMQLKARMALYQQYPEAALQFIQKAIEEKITGYQLHAFIVNPLQQSLVATLDCNDKESMAELHAALQALNFQSRTGNNEHKEPQITLVLAGNTPRSMRILHKPPMDSLIEFLDKRQDLYRSERKLTPDAQGYFFPASTHAMMCGIEWRHNENFDKLMVSHLKKLSWDIVQSHRSPDARFPTCDTSQKTLDRFIREELPPAAEPFKPDLFSKLITTSLRTFSPVRNDNYVVKASKNTYTAPSEEWTVITHKGLLQRLHDEGVVPDKVMRQAVIIRKSQDKGGGAAKG